LSDAERKNVEAIALKLDGPERVRNLQRFMSDYQWDEPWLGKRHWELCAETLSDPQGVWSLDASEFPKKGAASVGVAPQYCGALGKTANCQSGVFLCYSSAKGHALLESRLYLPNCWFEPAYEERRRLCHIPQDTSFRTKQQLAIGLLQPLLATQQFGGLLLRNDANCKIKYALSNAPQEFTMRELVRVSGARLLIERSFPEPKRQLSYVLILLEYHTRRNDQAYRSHRKRRMKELKTWKSLKTSL